MLKALIAIIQRELMRLVRQRGRLLSAMVRPLVWLLVIGSGFGTMMSQYGTDDYQQFLVPGLLCMVLLFGAMLSSLSLVYDKESGVMRMLVIAPFPHYWIILARTISATIAGLFQTVLLIVILFLLGFLKPPIDVPLFLLGLVMTSIVCASAGTLIAVFSKSLENFAVIMNFVIFPVFFLSGALYPLTNLPVILKIVTMINPFSYGVDLLKHAILLDMPASFSAEFSIMQDLLFMAGFCVIAMVVACLRFSQATVMENLASLLSTPKHE